MKESVRLPAVPKTPNTARTLTSTSLVPYQPSGSQGTRPNTRASQLMQSGGSSWQYLTMRSNRSIMEDTTRSMLSTPRSKPQIVADLEAFIERELLHLSKSAESCSVFERIPVVSEAFSAFINRCGDYSSLLTRIKHVYDEAVAEGQRAQRSNQRLELINENSMEYLSHIISTEKISSELQIKEKERQVREAQEAVNAKIAESNASSEEYQDLRQKVTHLSKIVEDLSLKNRVLTDGLKQEVMHRSLMVQQGKKLKAENDKLAKMVQHLEYKMRNDALLQATDAPPPAPLPQPNRGESQMSPQSSRGRLSSFSREDHGNTGSGTNASSAARQPSMRKEASSSGGGEDNSNRGESTEDRLNVEEKVQRLMHLLCKEMRERRSLEEQLREKISSRIDRPLTPRPNWTACKSILPRWTVPRLASDEILQEIVGLIKERLHEDRMAIEVAAMSNTIRLWFSDENMCESDLISGRVRTFVGRGNGPDVPIFLRFHGLLRNRQLRKGDVEKMLKDFWKDRTEQLSNSPSSTANLKNADAIPSSLTIQDFFMEWLTRKTGSRSSAIELSYNIVDVCSKYLHDPDCGIFLSILNGDVHESAYMDQLSVIEQLLMVMRHHDKNDIGLLKRARVHFMLQKVFPAKSLDCMLKLRFALLSHLNTSNDTIRYPEIFTEDSDGNQSRFVELVREQHMREMTEYIVDFAEAIRAAVTPDGMLNVSMIRTAIRFLDMNIPQPALEGMIACGINQPSLTPDMDTVTVDPEVFIRRVKRGVLLMPHTRKETAEDSEVDVNNLEEMDQEDLDDFVVDDSDFDPSTRAALQFMDRQLVSQANEQYGGEMGGVGKKNALPSVVEDMVSLLKPTTVEAMQKSAARGRRASAATSFVSVAPSQ